MLWMAEGLRCEQWRHTSATLAMLVNVNRDPKKTPLRLDHFNPYEEEGLPTVKGIPITADTIGQLKVFLPRRRPK